jgi:hypothetical protein
MGAEQILIIFSSDLLKEKSMDCSMFIDFTFEYALLFSSPRTTFKSQARKKSYDIDMVRAEIKHK